jgi:hypothetical protein
VITENNAEEIPAKPSPEELVLTETETAFLTEYLRSGNASQAARVAGLSNPGCEGHRMKKSEKIQAALRRELKNQHIDSDHVIAALSELCFCSLRDFMDDDGTINAAKVKAKAHLVKKYKARVVSRETDDKGTTTTVTVEEIELHDRHAALRDMANRFGLFKCDTTDEIARVLKALAEILKAKYPAEEVGQVFRQLAEAMEN